MQDLHFCPGCGAPIKADDLFCTACGFSLSSIKKSEVQPTPATIKEKEVPVNAGRPKPTGGSQKMNQFLPLIILLVIGGIIGVYFWQKNNDKSKTGLPGKKDNPISGVDTSKKDNTHLITDTKLPGSYSLDDYTGEWQIYESNQSGEMQPEEARSEEDLIIEKENGRLYIYPRSKKEEKYITEMSCGVPVGHVLTCRAKDGPTSEMITLTLELSQSKDDLTFSAIPDEPTEKMVAKLRKIK